MIRRFCLTVEQNQTSKQNCRFREISAALFSVYKIKINIRVSEDSKPSEQKRMRKKKSISRGCTTLLQYVPSSVAKAVRVHIFFLSFFCVRGVFIGFAQSAWINVSDTKEKWSGGELWIRAAVGFESRCSISSCNGTYSCIWALCSVTLNTVYFLEVFQSQVGLDTTASSSSKGFLYQKYCCASARQRSISFLF